MPEYSRILITGAAGSLGSHLRAGLTHLADRIRLVDINDMGTAAAHEEIVACNLADKAAALEATRDCDAILHFAGYPREHTFDEIIAETLPAGRVYAVDVEPDMVEYLAERARREKRDNLVALAGAPDDPRLPEKVDLILMVDVYHHVDDRARYFLGAVYTENKEYDKALASLSRIQQSSEYYPDARMYVSYVYQRQGKLDEAIAAYKAYEGTLSQGPHVLLRAFEDGDQLGQLAYKVWYYASLQYDEDQRNNAVNARRQRVQLLMARWQQATSWFNPELLQIPLATLRDWMDQSQSLAVYRFVIEHRG